MHRVIQSFAMLLWLALAFLTAFVIFTSGVGFLEILSVLVVAVLGIGVFGALGEPPRKGGPF